MRSEVVINGAAIPLWTYKQLEQLPRNTIKNRATTMRDQAGADLLMPFTAAGGQDSMIAWILATQCQVGFFVPHEPSLLQHVFTVTACRSHPFAARFVTRSPVDARGLWRSGGPCRVHATPAWRRIYELPVRHL